MKQLKYITSIAAKQTPTLLRFCTPHEQTIVRGHIPNAVFDGGYPGAERTRAYLFHDVIDNTTCLSIQTNDNTSLSHQSILGSLMGIGLERDMIGDILASQSVVFVATEVVHDIKRTVTTIGTTPVTWTIIDGSTIQRDQSFSDHQMIVSSTRLDQIVRHMTNQSRQLAKSMIEEGDVKRNHQIITKHTKEVEPSDIISIRHYGRFVFDDMTKRTKKNKVIVKYRKYE